MGNSNASRKKRRTRVKEWRADPDANQAELQKLAGTEQAKQAERDRADKAKYPGLTSSEIAVRKALDEQTDVKATVDELTRRDNEVNQQLQQLTDGQASAAEIRKVQDARDQVAARLRKANNALQNADARVAKQIRAAEVAAAKPQADPQAQPAGQSEGQHDVYRAKQSPTGPESPDARSDEASEEDTDVAATTSTAKPIPSGSIFEAPPAAPPPLTSPVAYPRVPEGEQGQMNLLKRARGEDDTLLPESKPVRNEEEALDAPALHAKWTAAKKLRDERRLERENLENKLAQARSKEKDAQDQVDRIGELLMDRAVSGSNGA